MKPTEADTKRFLDAYGEYGRASAAAAEARGSFIATAKAARAVIQSAPTAPGEADLTGWDPTPAYAAVEAMHSLAEAHGIMAEALQFQAEALDRTTTIALELIAGAGEDAADG